MHECPPMNARRSNHVRVNMKSVLETAFSRTKDLPPEKSSLEHVYRCGVGRLSARCRFFLFFGHFPWPAPAADGAIAHTVATAHSVSGRTPKRLPSNVVPTAYMPPRQPRTKRSAFVCLLPNMRFCSVFVVAPKSAAPIPCTYLL